MGFAFKKDETVARGITRIVDKEARVVLDCLTSKTGSAKERFHQARKRLKKIRATLRLVREEIGETAFRHENAAFRDVARVLSNVRDAYVLPETLDALLAHYGESTEPFAPLRENLDHAVRRSTNTRKAAHELRRAIDRVSTYDIRHEGWKAIRGGIRSNYAQCRRRFLDAFETPTDAHFHEWRKSVKYLRHHIDLVSQCWKKPLEELSEQLHALSTCLGGDHDLAVLRDRLPEEQTALRALIARRQLELRAAAEPLARRLFAEKPGAFTRRLGEYWDAWHVPSAPGSSTHFASQAYAAQLQQ